MKNYDVAIIGAGPAGLFAAHYILTYSENTTILLIDKGKSVLERSCCGNCSICADKDCCNVLCGVGGCGLFSDGKLILDLHSGGKLDSISNLSEVKREKIKTFIVDALKKHDGKSEQGPNLTDIEEKNWKNVFAKAGMEIKRYNVLHMGTENLQHITEKFAQEICKNPRVALKVNCEIQRVEKSSCGKSILFSSGGELFSATNLIFSVGKTGSEWLKNLFIRNRILLKKENTYIGIRVETPNKAIEKLFSYSLDPKIWAYYKDRKVKTHCFCRHGDIIPTNYMGVPVVGGHTRFTKGNDVPYEQQSWKGNFNVLASTQKSDKEIYGVLEQLSHLTPKGISKQSLLEFLYPKKNNGKKEEDIRTVLDKLDNTGEIISDFIFRMSKIVPGILSKESLIYAPALEWFMDSVEVDHNMETSHKGWFAVGDGAGLSQGIVHSAATSIIAAEEICRRLEK